MYIHIYICIEREIYIYIHTCIYVCKYINIRILRIWTNNIYTQVKPYMDQRGSNLAESTSPSTTFPLDSFHFVTPTTLSDGSSNSLQSVNSRKARWKRQWDSSRVYPTSPPPPRVALPGVRGQRRWISETQQQLLAYCCCPLLLSVLFDASYILYYTQDCHEIWDHFICRER